MKNPFMSAWMSAANRMIATTQAYAKVAMRQQAKAARSSAIKGGTKPGSPSGKGRRR
jgi:hypothetical protein